MIFRGIRNRGTHRFDEKEYLHGGGWTVKPPHYLPEGVIRYEGSRGLSEYLEAMVQFGREVLAQVPRVVRLAEHLTELDG